MACPEQLLHALPPSQPAQVAEQLAQCTLQEPALVEHYQYILSAVRELETVKEGFRQLNAPNALKEYFFYHNAHHAERVMELSVLIAVMERFSFEEILRIGEAGATHDIGKLVLDLQDEPDGAVMAQDIMAKKCYLASGRSLEDIVKDDYPDIPPLTIQEVLRPYQGSLLDLVLVGKMIEDTQLRPPLDNPGSWEREQRTSLRIAQPLLDADMAGIGLPEFFKDARDYYCELAVINNDMTLLEAKEYLNGSLETFLSDPKALSFLAFTESLFLRHDWHTETARALFEDKKRENLASLSDAVRRLSGSER